MKKESVLKMFEWNFNLLRKYLSKLLKHEVHEENKNKSRTIHYKNTIVEL